MLRVEADNNRTNFKNYFDVNVVEKFSSIVLLDKVYKSIPINRKVVILLCSSGLKHRTEYVVEELH